MSDDNVIRAFSTEHVARVTGLSNRQLEYWDETGFFRPRYAHENRRSPFSRVYSFRDVVGLRTLSILRKDHDIPLQTLRKVAEELSKYGEAPWATRVLYVLGKEVQFEEPESGKVRGVLSKQYVAIQLRKIAEDAAARSNRLREREASQLGKIERHRFVAHNAWVVAGTRIPVAAIQRFGAAGYSAAAIVREYPSLTEKDVAAALSHTSRKSATR